MWSDVERTQIDVLAGDLEPKSGRKMKRLKQFSKLFQLRQRRTRPKYKKSRQRDQVKPRGDNVSRPDRPHPHPLRAVDDNDHHQHPVRTHCAKDDEDDDDDRDAVDYHSMGAAAADNGHHKNANGAVFEEEEERDNEMEEKLSKKLIAQRKYSGD